MGPSECMLFVPQDGGLGVLLTCTSSSGTSSRTAFPDPTESSVYEINNLGADPVMLAFGNSSVVATTSYKAVQPGTTYMGIPNAGGSGAPTHVAGICLSGAATTFVQISAGNLIPSN